MKRFCVRALPLGELISIAEHLAACPPCQEEFTQALRSRRGSAPLKFMLAPEFGLRHDHVDYEQLVGLADGSLDATERDMVDVHLKVCASCQEDVRSFLTVREQIDEETESSFAPIAPDAAPEFPWLAWWRGLAWKPVYAAAVVVIGIAIVIGATLLLKRRASNLQAHGPTPQGSPISTPDNRAANVASPPATPNESPVEKPSSAEAIVVLNDRGRTITVNEGGNVAGLDDVPAPTRDEIAKVLISERLEQPAILKELRGQEGSLRGSKTAQPFKLNSPSRTVIVTDRPTLKWEKASGASSYRVYVNDSAGHEITRSEELSSEHTEWRLPKPLKRGEIYVWTVIAVIDGKEIVSPGPSSPEIKFQVLSSGKLRELSQVKTTSSHLALGIFYANVGLKTEAEVEFRHLVQMNPKSKLVRHLLRSLQSQ